MGGHGSGPSSYEIMKKQQEAEEAKRREIARQRDAETAAANKEASQGEMIGGEGSGDYNGALSGAKKKKGSTLAGEGAQTFGASTNLGG